MDRIDGSQAQTPAPRDAQPLAPKERIRSVLQGQNIAVLCTQGEAQPYGSLVFYAFAPDLGSMAFATPRASWKYEQLCACQNVALLIDTRTRFPKICRRSRPSPQRGRSPSCVQDKSLRPGPTPSPGGIRRPGPLRAPIQAPYSVWM